MPDRFRRGQMVTVMPPYDNDPLIISMQHYGRIAEVRDDGYMVTLGAVWPPDAMFGPFPAERLQESWRDPNSGVWWVRT